VQVGAVEVRATSPGRPADGDVPPAFFSEKMPVQLARASFARRVVDTVASAPLYRLHCTVSDLRPHGLGVSVAGDLFAVCLLLPDACRVAAWFNLLSSVLS